MGIHFGTHSLLFLYTNVFFASFCLSICWKGILYMYSLRKSPVNEYNINAFSASFLLSLRWMTLSRMLIARCCYSRKISVLVYKVFIEY